MRDYLYLGSTPSEEKCAQVGSDNYYDLAQAECTRFIELLRKTFGPEPEGAQLRIKYESHDFGTYLEVVCYFSNTHPESVEYAYRLDKEAPQTWEG